MWCRRKSPRLSLRLQACGLRTLRPFGDVQHLYLTLGVTWHSHSACVHVCRSRRRLSERTAQRRTPLSFLRGTSYCNTQLKKSLTLAVLTVRPIDESLCEVTRGSKVSAKLPNSCAVHTTLHEVAMPPDIAASSHRIVGPVTDQLLGPSKGILYRKERAEGTLWFM